MLNVFLKETGVRTDEMTMRQIIHKLGQQVHKLRVERSLGMKVLATQLGTTTHEIGLLENGISCKKSMVIRIIDILQVTDVTATGRINRYLDVYNPRRCGPIFRSTFAQ